MTQIERLIELARDTIDDPDWDASDKADVQEALIAALPELEANTKTLAELVAACEAAIGPIEFWVPKHEVLDQLRAAIQNEKG